MCEPLDTREQIALQRLILRRMLNVLRLGEAIAQAGYERPDPVELAHTLYQDKEKQQ